MDKKPKNITVPPELMFPGQAHELEYFEQSIVFSQYTVPLDEGISEPSYYRGVFQMLQQCKEGDEVRIEINNGGGNLMTALHFATLLQSCAARTVAVIACECHSAASVIALACQEFEVMPWAHMLIHNAEYGVPPTKAADVEAYVEFSKRQLGTVLKSVYTGFLSKGEILRAIRGEQLYYDYDDILKRLKKYAEHRAALRAEADQSVQVQEG